MSWVELREMQFGQLGTHSEELSTAERGGNARIDMCLRKGDPNWHLPSWSSMMECLAHQCLKAKCENSLHSQAEVVQERPWG